MITEMSIIRKINKLFEVYAESSLLGHHDEAKIYKVKIDIELKKLIELNEGKFKLCQFCQKEKATESITDGETLKEVLCCVDCINSMDWKAEKRGGEHS